MNGSHHAIVTGGGSGIGAAITHALARAGYQVSVLGRQRAKLEDVCMSVDRLVPIECDVGDGESVASAFAEASAKSGAIGLLVNCAGIAPAAAFEKTSDEVWEQVWRTNVLGAIHTMRAVLPDMRGLPFGRIVNIASTTSFKAYANMSAYTVSKHALLGLTRSLALELADTAITVNAVCPGYADTAIIRRSISAIMNKSGLTEAEALARFTRVNPQGRLISPDEVAETVLWLANKNTRSITGQAIVVAGGEIM